MKVNLKKKKRTHCNEFAPYMKMNTRIRLITIPVVKKLKQVELFFLREQLAWVR